MQTQSTHRFDPDDTYPPPYAQGVGGFGNPGRVLLNLTPDLMLAGDLTQLRALLRDGLAALSVAEVAIVQPTRYRFGAMGMEEVTDDDE